MKHKIIGLLVAVLLAVMAPAHANPAGIIPGKSLGGIELGMNGQQVEALLGKPDFHKTNDDGTELIEYGLLSKDDLPDARLWIIAYNGKAARIGTDGPAREFLTTEGLGVGSLFADFVEAYNSGQDARMVGPGLVLFSNNLGVGVREDGTVSTVYIESPELIHAPAS